MLVGSCTVMSRLIVTGITQRSCGVPLTWFNTFSFDSRREMVKVAPAVGRWKGPGSSKNSKEKKQEDGKVNKMSLQAVLYHKAGTHESAAPHSILQRR